MSQRITPPHLNAADLSTHDLCRLYRILDNLEETANMALHYIICLDGGATMAGAYVDKFQEYLSEERGNIIDALRERPNTTDGDGQRRMGTIVQFEAWCQEFHKSTLDELITNPLSTEAI
ncbi:hypothetical protein [Rhizobium sp. SG741]|uniref:hypothetical protein n=1 Tax=Rhizobium sp. SG741 TaxID=2587114 RepID=UPI001447B231|nr:hypothetical protein [Rhizobium sp. SG741]NKJ03447.1 hypothetical protein [Rhizobium sp. SG741]